jgi:phenylacetate-CoA ligase
MMLQEYLFYPLLRRFFARRLALLESKRELYHSVTDPSAIRAFQTNAVNAQWQSALAKYTFYRQWQYEHGLPDRIESLAQLAEFPVLQKKDLLDHAKTIEREAGPCRWATTGGSTGQPVRFPLSSADLDEFYSNSYLGRSWWNIAPFSRIFMLWGHSHLFGTGIGGQIREWQRRINDYIIGTTRLNAYRLGEEDIMTYYAKINLEPEASVIAYASAFSKVLDYIEKYGQVPTYSSHRRILLTSEYIFPQDVKRIRDIFGVEPIIEYGAAETGVIATSEGSTDHLRVMWNSFVCQQASDNELILTTLWNRHFPLFRYAIGDRVRVSDASSDSILFFSEVLGRSNDALRLPLKSGRTIKVHSEFFTHIIKSLPNVQSFLIVESSEKIKVKLRFRDNADLHSSRQLALQKIRREFPDVLEERITFESLADEVRTIAGKHRFIIRE